MLHTKQHFVDHIPDTRKKAKPQKNVWYTQNSGKGENLFADVASVKDMFKWLFHWLLQKLKPHPVALYSCVFQWPDASSVTFSSS
jgi:hypothetical protein